MFIEYYSYFYQAFKNFSKNSYLIHLVILLIYHIGQVGTGRNYYLMEIIDLPNIHLSRFYSSNI